VCLLLPEELVRDLKNKSDNGLIAADDWLISCGTKGF
jgi:hypothetical protein